MPEPRKSGAGESSSSGRILQALKLAGRGMTAQELCAQLSLSSMAVRRQLTILERDALIVSRREKKKERGRPGSRYHLSAKGHEQFERDYASMAVEILVSLRTLDSPQKIHEVFRQRKREQIERYRPRMVGRTLESRVHQMSKLLTESGFMAKWEKVEPDRYLISLMNCAVDQVARKFPHVCVCEEELLEDLLGARVTRKHYILQKDHFCSYLVEPLEAD